MHFFFKMLKFYHILQYFKKEHSPKVVQSWYALESIDTKCVPANKKIITILLKPDYCLQSLEFNFFKCLYKSAKEVCNRVF